MHRSYPTRFYVFEDATSPQILLSYAMSERLGILEFKVPNLVAHSHIDTLTIPSFPTSGRLRKATKWVTFCDPLINLDQPDHINPYQGGLGKTTCKVTFSDLVKSTINSTQHKISQPHSYSLYQPLKPVFPTPHYQTKASPQGKGEFSRVTSPTSTAIVQDIIALKQVFPDSFDTIGNMSGTYTIRTDPYVAPVQHAQWKIPIEYQEQIEHTLDDMVDKGVIAPVSQPTEWVSSLTYPH